MLMLLLLINWMVRIFEYEKFISIYNKNRYMLITKTIEIKLNAKTVKHYWELGYTGKPNEIICVNVNDLIKTSHYNIECICQNCNGIKKISYRNYIRNTNNYNIYYCHSCCDLKKILTCRNKHGVDHVAKTTEVKEKKKKTCIEKYGVSSYFSSKEFLSNDKIKEKVRLKKILQGINIPDSELTPFLKYKMKCRNLTKKVKNKLFETWDGFDYYDKEYIKEYLNLHHTNKNYPTIDHKISVFYGFKNNIKPEMICDIKNLCITKRKINSSKREKNESVSLSKILESK